MDHKPVVTRIPPSPTGRLHIGTVRTALFNYLFAEKHGGHMIFRSEDTDQARSKREYEEEIIAGLSWLGLRWQNETIYRQSERTAIYKTYLEKLIAAGTAYASKEPSKQNPEEMIEVIRLKNPNKAITFLDEIRGEITFDTTELGDFVIARSIEDALYHFTVVVDDHEMGITHVIRGEDHISNTPRQILIQEAIGATRPHYAHLPLILAPDRSKMSKRHGAVALIEYQKEGFLKEAIVNYLALLGWSPGTDQEFFSLEELAERFDLAQVQKGGAIFDKQKFTWFNRHYLAQLSDDELRAYLAAEEFFSALPQFSNERLEKLLPTIRERISTKKEFEEQAKAGEYHFAFAVPDYEVSLLKWKKDETVASAAPRLLHLKKLLTVADFSSPEAVKGAIWPYAEEVGKGEVLWPLRVALSGREQSPDPFTLAFILGQEETESRLQFAYDKIAA
ncbi:MAG: glutamate--tRNA ligase [Patescibacteria group bacterium]